MCGNVVIIMIIFILFIVGGCSAYQYYSFDKCDVIWFFRDSCGYCKKMSSEWDKFVKMSPHYIRPVKIDVSKPENFAIARKYNVNSVPYIVKIQKGKSEVYAGNRTALEIMKWAKV
jgi:thiol-disulfide isomerase/thioredoxin